MTPSFPFLLYPPTRYLLHRHLLFPFFFFSFLFPENWPQASTDFFESFKQFDESGSPQRIQVLKYLVLANMLMGSEINPFDSQETKPFSVFFSSFFFPFLLFIHLFISEVW